MTRLVFAQCKVENPLVVLTTGYDALGYFRGTGVYANRELSSIASVNVAGFAIAWTQGSAGIGSVAKATEFQPVPRGDSFRGHGSGTGAGKLQIGSCLVSHQTGDRA